MKQAIRDSFTLRIFFVTGVLLIAVCMLTYMFIIYFMPNTYLTVIRDGMKKDALTLINDLTISNFYESSAILNEFSAVNQVSITLLDNRGNPVDIPGYVDSFSYDESENNLSVSDGGQRGNSGMISQIYPFSFASSGTQYKLLIVGSVQLVNEAADVLIKILPYLIVMILIMSFFVSWLYSRYFTRPIIKLSEISENMSKLDFEWQDNGHRRDEIGKLSTNISNLSSKLYETLEELRASNRSL